MKIASIGFLSAIAVLSIGQTLAQPSGPLNFADIDNNQDGVLTVDEVKELPAVKNRGVNVDRLFNALDSDKNGLLGPGRAAWAWAWAWPGAAVWAWGAENDISKRDLVSV
jgi:hypothetical protein